MKPIKIKYNYYFKFIRRTRSWKFNSTQPRKRIILYGYYLTSNPFVKSWRIGLITSGYKNNNYPSRLDFKGDLW